MKLNEDLGVAEASEQWFHLILSCYAHFLNYISLYLILHGIFCHEQTQTRLTKCSTLQNIGKTSETRKITNYILLSCVLDYLL